MATETLEFKLTLDGRAAQRGLEETRAAAEKMGGGLERAQTAMRGLQSKLAPAAAAVAGLSAAMGQSNGEAGKMVAAAGQVVAAFGAGGPYAAALVAGTAAVDALTRAWENEIKAQDAAIAAQTAGAESIIATNKKLKESIAANRIALQGGETPGEIRAAAAQRVRDIDIEMVKLRAEARNNKDRRDNINAEIRNLETQQQLIMMDAGGRAALAARKSSGPRVDYSGRFAAFRVQDQGSDAFNFSQAGLKQRIAENAEARAEVEMRAQVEEADKWAAYEREKFEAAQKAEQARTELAQQESERRRQIAQQEAEAVAATYTGLAVGLAGALGTFAAEAALGQEAALEHLLAAASQQAGGFIMLEGGKLVAQGIVSAAGGNPAGLGQVAIGAGVVAAGAAVQTGGPLAVQMLLGQAGAAGGGSSTRSDPGARARAPSSSSRDTGGTNITIVYGGASGPTADQGADAVVQAQKKAKKRGLR